MPKINLSPTLIILLALAFLTALPIVVLAEDLIDNGEIAAVDPFTATIITPINNHEAKIGETITFNSVATGGNAPYVFHWDFGDDTTFNGRPYNKSYTKAGTFNVQLTVTDFSGASKTVSITVIIVNPILSLRVTIESPAINHEALVGESINFSASASGGVPPYVFVWTFGDGTSFNGPSQIKNYATAGSKTVSLVVTDFSGARTVDSINLIINAPPIVPIPLSVSITAPTSNSMVEINKSLTFNASATGGQPPYTFTWTFGDNTTGSGQTVDKVYIQTGTKIITLTAKDFKSQEASSSIAVIVTTTPLAPGPDPIQVLTISDIRVTDITTTSAIIRWTTNKPATSRVIYDVVSHSSVAGQVAPNFGYASSTVMTDADTKATEHAVPVSHLSPATSYYFRVISQ